MIWPKTVAKWVLQRLHPHRNLDHPDRSKVVVQYEQMKLARVQNEKHMELNEVVKEKHRILEKDLLEVRELEGVMVREVKVQVMQVMVMRELDLPGRHQVMVQQRILTFMIRDEN